MGALLTRALEAAEQKLRQGAPDASAEASVQEPAGTPCQQQADALGLLAERALDGMGRVERGEPCQVVLHVDEPVLSGQQTQGGRCHLEDGPALAAETARRLSCDATTVTLEQDADGQPLDVDRKTRRVSTALFRALKARDQTCQFPGCDKTGSLTPHHVTHWAAGGATDQNNLCLLGSACHWRVHEGGFTVRGQAPDALTFSTPAGVELSGLAPMAPSLPADPVAALKALHTAEGLEIRPQTNVIRWQGQRWDLGWAMESLLSYSHEQLNEQRDEQRKSRPGSTLAVLEQR